ncbi:MAG: hypothetical protein IKZ08_02545 [Bacteroidales bacterium]|nr:hypothetical protein [Bacteroidales bacterium]
MEIQNAMYYSYGGIRLPKLPEYDKAKYPYAIITCQQTNDSTYGLRIAAYACFCEQPAVRISTGEAMPKGAKYLTFRCANPGENSYRLDGDQDPLPSFSEGFESYMGERTASGTKTSYPVIWADHDILDSNGQVYMAASEPVPINALIYEGKAGDDLFEVGWDQYYVRLSDKPYDLREVSEIVECGGDQSYSYPNIEGISTYSFYLGHDSDGNTYQCLGDKVVSLDEARYFEVEQDEGGTHRWEVPPGTYGAYYGGDNGRIGETSWISEVYGVKEIVDDDTGSDTGDEDDTGGDNTGDDDTGEGSLNKPTLTFDGVVKDDDIFVQGLLRVSEKPYSLAHVDSVTLYNEGETFVIGSDDIVVLDITPQIQAIVGADGTPLAATAFVDAYMDGISSIIPAGTYVMCAVPDLQVWVSKVEGVVEIDGDVLCFDGTPKEEDIVLGQAVRLSDKPYDLSGVYSVTMYNEGEFITFGSDRFRFIVQSGILSIMDAETQMPIALTVLADTELEGMLVPKGTYGICGYPDSHTWTCRIEGASEIGESTLLFDGNTEGKDVSGGLVKVSDKIYDLSGVTKIIFCDNLKLVTITDFKVKIEDGLSYIDDDGVGFIFAVSDSDVGEPGIYFRYVHEFKFVYGVWGVKEIKSDKPEIEPDVAEISAGTKYLLHQLFPPIIADALSSTPIPS